MQEGYGQAALEHPLNAGAKMLRSGRRSLPFDRDRTQARQTSGLTSRLILAYVERQKGSEAVKSVLRLAELEDREELLRDENYWFDFQTKIRLFEAAAEVLEDPDVALNIGVAALDLNVASGLKLALRAFGSPRLIYGNVGRASGKFTWAHTWEIMELGSNHARLRYTDVAGVGYHRLDCQYNQGLLSCPPSMFGMPPAEIDHSACAVHGEDACVYEVRWGERSQRSLWLAGLAAATGAAASALAVIAPSLLPAAAAAPALGGAFLYRRECSRLRRTCRSLQGEVREQREVADRLSTSLQDLVSDLRLEEVLGKITQNAQAAVGGKQFVLLVKNGSAARCISSTGIPPHSLEALEQWATLTGEVFETPLVLDDLSTVPLLAKLPREASMPLGSLRAAPLVVKDEQLGVLLALAHGPEAFLPQDAVLLESYAAQAAIALSDARLVERLERLARQDPLTGLLNHREYHEAVERELERCERYGGRFSVLLFDLDGFKRVNDQHGHAQGDDLLCAVASEIRAACRSSDIACRVGGDEFAIILPESTSRQALPIVERIQAALKALPAAVEVSFGVGEWPGDGPTKDLLLLRADLALYSNKPTRRGGHSLAGEGGEDHAIEFDSAHARLVLDRLTLQACESLGVEKAVVLVRDGSPSSATAVAGHRVPHDFLHGHRIHEGITGLAFSRGEPTVICDYQQLAHRADHEAVSDLRAVASVPLRWGGVVRAVLSAGTTDPAKQLGEQDLRMLSELADVGCVSLENAHMRQQLDRTVQAGVEAMALAVDLRDSYTARHSEEVVELARKVGGRLSLDPIALVELEFAARLHDLGKIGVPDTILKKPDKLDPEEWQIMHQHPAWGEEMLKRIPGLERVAAMVRSEHERWDGRGYPDRLCRDDIPLQSRIIFACDAYHAMTSDRPYRPALGPEAARAELLASAGSQFDPTVVQALIEALGTSSAPEDQGDERTEATRLEAVASLV